MKMTHFSLNKRLGQYFLKSKRPLALILKSAGEEKPIDLVLEVGPGRGALTRSLAQVFPKIIAVEKDRILAGELIQALAKENISNCEIISGDILKVDIAALLGNHTYAVIANIPYYLTSRLIRMFLEHQKRPNYMILMVQKEVAERIVAKPPAMNLLAISVQVYGRPQIIARVPKENFSPQPGVDSAIVKISDISKNFFTKKKISEKDFFALIRAGFSQKRKQLANALSRFYGSKSAAAEKIKSAGLSSRVRSQELSPEDWVWLLAGRA